MRTYMPHWEAYGISRERYRELMAYCRQYQEWLAEARSLLGAKGQRYSSVPRAPGVTDPVAVAAERREILLAKVDTIEQAAKAVEGGKWKVALIQNCCMGRALSAIDQTIMPTSNRNAYYNARRLFFIALNELKN